MTPLIRAVKSKHRKTSLLLLESGCERNVRGMHGMTALNEAVFSNSPHLVSLLLKHGADPDVEDDGGTLPLWFAVDSSNLEIIKLLTNSGCRFDIRSTLSNSCRPCNALEHAVHKQRTPILKYLVGVYCEEAINCLLQMKISPTNLFSNTVLTRQELIECPPSAKNLCRKTIRRSLRMRGRMDYENDLKQLKLPKSIETFLLYNDIEDASTQCGMDNGVETMA